MMCGGPQGPHTVHAWSTASADRRRRRRSACRPWRSPPLGGAARGRVPITRVTCRVIALEARELRRSALETGVDVDDCVRYVIADTTKTQPVIQRGDPWTWLRGRFGFRAGGAQGKPRRDPGARPLGTACEVCDDQAVRPTVLIVDDHSTFRASARRLLENEGFDVVGEASDGQEGLVLAHRLAPKLVLLDVALPDMSGYDVAEQLRGSASQVVLVSSRAQEDLGHRVRESGALGFISKDRLTGEAILALATAT